MRVRRLCEGRSTARRLGGFISLVSFLALLGPAGCAGDREPATGPTDETPLGHRPILGLTMSDEFGQVVNTTGEVPEGAFSILAGDSASFVVSMVTPAGTFSPREEGNRLVVTGVLSDSTIVAAGLSDGDSTTILHLRGLRPGSSAIRIEIRESWGILHTSPWIAVLVSRPEHGWWSGFAEEDAPNGPVRQMLTYHGELLLTGDFTRVGSLPADGIAAWNGQQWSNSIHHLDGLQWLLTEGDLLVGGGADAGFHRWDGAQWVAFAPGRPGAEAAALFHGEIVVATGRESGVEVWRDGRWQVIATGSQIYPYALAVCGDALYVGAERLRYTMMFQSAVVAKVAAGALVPIYEVGGEDNTSASIDHLAGTGDHLVAAWSHGSPGGERSGVEQWLRGSLYREISFDRPFLVRGSAMVGDALFLVERQSVLLREGDGLRTIGITGGGEIYDATSFQGSLFVGGSFTSLPGSPAYRLARWVP